MEYVSSEAAVCSTLSNPAFFSALIGSLPDALVASRISAGTVACRTPLETTSLDFLATTLAAAIADIRRVGGDDIAFLHGIAILFRHLIFDIGNLEQTLVVAPLHIGDGACCGRVACHTIRLGMVQ